MAPWSWSVLSMLAIAATEILVGFGGGPSPPKWAVPLRFAAAMTAFMPLVAMLGAKRPQDRAWQFVVLALWAILSLPAAQWLAFGGVREIHPARFWFLTILTIVTALNGIGTRAWLENLLVATGQAVLVAAFLPSSRDWLPDARGPLVALLAFAIAWTLWAARSPRASAGNPTQPIGSPLDHLWLDFRDAFGVVWSLRIIERTGAAARQHDWPVTLTWQGFRGRDADRPASEVPPAAAENFRALLRRFVSPERIKSRQNAPSGQDIDGASGS
jgi:hypothetical protein